LQEVTLGGQLTAKRGEGLRIWMVAAKVLLEAGTITRREFDSLKAKALS